MSALPYTSHSLHEYSLSQLGEHFSSTQICGSLVNFISVVIFPPSKLLLLFIRIKKIMFFKVLCSAGYTSLLVLLENMWMF